MKTTLDLEATLIFAENKIFSIILHIFKTDFMYS